MVWLVALALAAAVSYQSAALSMQVLRRRLDSGVPIAVASAPALQKRRAWQKMPLSDFQAVLNDNIFGARRSQVNPVASGAAPALTPSPAAAGGGNGGGGGAAAPLQVTLTGTMIAGRRAFALVADAAGHNERVYEVEDCLPMVSGPPTRTCTPTQGKLVAVFAHHIVVSYRGHRLTFDLSAEHPPSGGPPRLTGLHRPGRRPEGAPSSTAANAPFPMTQQGNQVQVQVPSSAVNKAFENFSEVLKDARVVPYTDKQGSGFQIRNIRPGSIFDRIGLDNFDKIKAVNGQPITTADQALRLLTMFRNERQISLDIERKNQPMQLNYTIQ